MAGGQIQRVRMLRDLAHSSRVLILLELRRRPAPKLKPLADAVRLTQQAVSGYLKHLEAEGLATRTDGSFRITTAGEAVLEAEIGELKAFADRAARELVGVDSCAAVAGTAVKKGERVGLFMTKGRLVAFPGRTSPSEGVALSNAEAEGDVFVGQLKGIVEIAPAALTLVQMPPGREGGSASADFAWLKAFSADRPGAWWAALDEVGEGALRKARLPFEFEFAPFESGRAAVQRGVNPVFVGAPESVGLLVAAIEAAKAQGKLPQFTYKVVHAKRGAPRAAPRKAARSP